MPIDEVLRTHLTNLQYNAAIDNSREVLCLACAGSGKSRTLAFRIARLIAEGEDPHSIVAFTFTKKAAESIKNRVASALAAAGLEPTILGAIYIGTIHSFCQNILSEMDAKYRQFDVLDDNRLKLYLMSRYGELEIYNLRRARGAAYFETINKVADAWKTANDELLPLQSVTQIDENLGSILERMERQLDRDRFIDFSLMIRKIVEAFRNRDPGILRIVPNIRHLMVDEYQDVNTSQEALIRELHEFITSLFVVGDDDQAIYAWRGADVSNILTFRTRYPNCSPHTLSEISPVTIPPISCISSLTTLPITARYRSILSSK